MTGTETTQCNPTTFDSARLLREILEGTATTVGEPFLTALVTTLAKVFQVRYVVIGRLQSDGKTVRTLKVLADGSLVDNISYPLCGTPCETVIGKAPRYFPSGAADLFPEDELLRLMGVACYLGVPLYATSGEPLGNLLMMDSAHLPEHLAEVALQLLQLFALRTAGEIERIEREEQLMQQDAHLSIILHESRDGLFSTDTQARIVSANPAYCRLLGYDSNELIGKHISEIEAVESPQDIAERARKLLEEGFDRFISRHRCKDGSIRDLELSISHLPHSGRFFTIARDLTEQLRLEQQLHESEERYKAFTELSSDFCHVCVRKPDGPYRVQWVGGQFERITGYSEQELYAIGCWMPLVHPDDRERISANLLGLKPDDEHRSEFRLIRKDQSVRWIRERIRCVRDRNGIDLRLYGSSRDITTAHENAAALQAAENAYRTVFNAVNDTIFILDPASGIIIDCNRQAQQLFARPRVELIGATPLHLTPPDSSGFGPEQARQVIQDALEGTPQVFEWLCSRPFDSAQGRPDAGSFWGEVSLRATEINGRRRLLAVVRDISERKLAVTELQRTRDAAQAATIAKNEFLANMSHEVRTPLNGIMGISQLLRTTPLSAEQQGYMDMLDSSARNLLVLINDILDISKIEAGCLTIQQSPFSPAKLLREIKELYEKAAAEKGIDLELELDGTLPNALVGDPLRLKQILVNLLGNAVKFTSHGGVRLSLTCSSDAAQGDRFLFEVSDSGIGMSEETLQKIFNPFTQADASTSRVHGGSGLGLAICRRLSELMGGSIRAESSPGNGSRFLVELPFARYTGQETEQTEETPASPVVPLAPLRLLLVEDQEVNRAFVQRLLERQGHRVDPAADGLMALDLLERERYDLMLLDIQMPGMGGEEVIGRVRDRERQSGDHLPTIALTAHALAGDREKLISAGFDGYVAKPVQMDQLLAEMGRVRMQLSERNHGL